MRARANHALVLPSRACEPHGRHCHAQIYAEDHKRLPSRVFVGTESVAVDSHRMWTDVWSLHAVIGDFSVPRRPDTDMIHP